MATVEEKRARIKNDMETVINGLSRNDRRQLSCFFGFIGVKGHRKEHKSWKTANLYVKCQLFPFLSLKEETRMNSENVESEGNRNEKNFAVDEKDIDSETRPFDIEKEIDFKSPFSMLFKNDVKSVIKFYVEEGLDLTETMMVSMIRLVQVRERERERERERDEKMRKYIFS